MNYRCNVCSTTVTGNDGKLLYSIPSHIRQEYPVDPRFATNQDFHLSVSFSDWLRDLLVTDTSGDKVARSVLTKQGAMYERELDSYLEQCAHTGVTEAREYPSFREWIGRFPPSGSHLRDLIDSTALSNLTMSGVSDFQRCKREIQSVSCASIMSQDHTMEIVKNYPAKLGGKAVWDVANENGEIASLVLVPSTAASDYAHAAESLARRPNFQPKVMYSDTWPNGKAFWELLFGSGMAGRLGLFHFMQRITKTLRPNHIDYRQALSKLRAGIYRYTEETEANVIRALKNGTLGGQAHSDDDIIALRNSPRWKSLCDPFLRKILFPADTIRLNLEQWFVSYKVDASPGQSPGGGRLDPVSGAKLFTPATKGTIEECKKTCEYLSDLLPEDVMYRTAKPSARSTHGLELQISNRGESRLESFHGLSSDMANTNMRPSLLDTLTLMGTAEANANIRERIKYEQMDSKEKKKARLGNLLFVLCFDSDSHLLLARSFQVPAWLHGQPIFYNDSNKAALNVKAAAVGAPSPFTNVRPLPEDNGEVFLSEYLFKQLERNEMLTAHPENDRCQCDSCAKSSKPLPYQIAEAPPNSVWNAYTRCFVSGGSAQDDSGLGSNGSSCSQLAVEPSPVAAEGPSHPTTCSATQPTRPTAIRPSSTANRPALAATQPVWTEIQPALVPNNRVAMGPPPPAPAISTWAQPMPMPAPPHWRPAAMLPAQCRPFPYGQLSLVPRHVESTKTTGRKRGKSQREYCCEPMMKWCATKTKGRTPHADDCPMREKNQGKKRQRTKKKDNE